MGGHTFPLLQKPGAAGSCFVTQRAIVVGAVSHASHCPSRVPDQQQVLLLHLQSLSRISQPPPMAASPARPNHLLLGPSQLPHPGLLLCRLQPENPVETCQGPSSLL